MNSGITFEKLLGEGKFCKVFLGRDKEGKHLAIKVFDPENFSNKDFSKHFKNELIIHSTIIHPGITQIKSIFNSNNKICICMDLAEEGNLVDKISVAGKFQEEIAKTYFYELMSAIEHLHENGYAHRDIKLDNILLTHDNHIKITDFGMSKASDSNSPLTTLCGSVEYCAPEILHDKPYNEKVDIWSAGVVLYAMVFGRFPWKSRTVNELISEIKFSDVQIPINDYSIDLNNLLSSMFSKDPDSRPSAKSILSCKWLSDVNYDPPEVPETNISQQVKSLLERYNLV